MTPPDSTIIDNGHAHHEAQHRRAARSGTLISAPGGAVGAAP